METKVIVDLSGLNGQLLALNEALIGQGQDGDLSKIIKTEGRHLAWECSNQLGPMNQARGERKIEADVRTVFHPMMTREGQEWDVFSGYQAEGGDTRWLYAGPSYLVGAKWGDVKTTSSNSALRSLFKSAKKSISRGNAWLDKGKRGKQHVMIVDRYLIKKAQFNALVAEKNKRVGRMRATFAYAASLLGQGRIPKWISRHFDAVSTDGAALYDATKLNDKQAPAIAFGGSTPGLSNFAEKIDKAAEVRFHKVAAKVADAIKGYARQWNSGQEVNSQAKVE